MNMDVQLIFDFITTLGFPIFCCVYMAWYINKSDTIHRDEVGRLTEIIQNNTVALTKLTDQINCIKSHIHDNESMRGD